MADRLHTSLGVAAVVIVAAGFIGWRSLRAPAGAMLAAPVPNPNLSPLMPYATPLSDTLLVAASAGDSTALPRDPFGAVAVERVAESTGAPTDGERSKTDENPWHVTTTLMAGTRRAALINDVLVYVGDALPGGGGKLTAVERDHVIVTDLKGALHTVAVAKEGND